MATTIDPQEAAETDVMYAELCEQRSNHGSKADETMWAAPFLTTDEIASYREMFANLDNILPVDHDSFRE